MINEPLQPGSTIGIFGGGQLGRFLAIAASKLGFKTIIYAPDQESPAFQVASDFIIAAYDDRLSLERFAQSCDRVAFEFENVPQDAIAFVHDRIEVRPNAYAAGIAQDRIAERRFLSNLELPVAPHEIIETQSDLKKAYAFLEQCGLGLLKCARDGYDGKGQKRISSFAELEDGFTTFATPCILEALIPFDIELSVILVRGYDGDIVCYDIPRNEHRNGVLHQSTMPAPCSLQISQQAQSIAKKIANALEYIGVLGVELFLVKHDDQHELIINEIAPRVHNTGHWTLDACFIDQFENHIRAVAGWPLGSTQRHSNAIMTNLLGRDVLDWQDIVKNDASMSLYIYGKTGIREGRKQGHMTQLKRLENK